MKKNLVSAILSAALLFTAAAADSFSVEPTEPYKVPYTGISPAQYNSVAGNNFNGKISPYKTGNYSGAELRWVEGVDDGDVPGGDAPCIKYTNGKTWTESAYGENNGFFLFLYSGSRLPDCTEGQRFVNEFDVKFDTNTDALLWYASYIPLWGANNTTIEQYTLFGADGKLKDTDYSYPVGEWIHVKLIYNPADGKYNVAVTDSTGEYSYVKYRNDKNAGWMPSYGRINFTVHQVTEKAAGEETAGVAFDNFKIYKIEDPSNGLIYSPSDNETISDLSGNDFSANVSDADEVVFKIDGKTVKTFDSPDRAAYTYSYSTDLFGEESGEKTFSVFSVKDGNETLLSERKFNFEAKCKWNVKINDAEFNVPKPGEKLSVTVRLKSKKETSSFIAVCAYDKNGGLCAVTTKNVADSECKAELDIPEAFSDNAYIYLFESPMEIADFLKIK